MMRGNEKDRVTHIHTHTHTHAHTQKHTNKHAGKINEIAVMR